MQKKKIHDQPITTYTSVLILSCIVDKTTNYPTPQPKTMKIQTRGQFHAWDNYTRIGIKSS